MNLIESVESEHVKADIPDFGPGDLVRVNTRIREGSKERIQAYEGTVIRRSNGGLRETFTVRRVAYGEGSERTFPAHSPNIESIQIIRYGAIRRAKLYYLRDRTGKGVRIRERRQTTDNA
ncbi:50S ribosomal protein L19 [Candidatus Poribacteria bacterium]|nr:50S ribosomal protein L19 [Candidatus Poribacteria bacterium]